jgi:hypothetical protein
MHLSGRLLPGKAIRRGHAQENEITRHRITSFQFVEHQPNVGRIVPQRKEKLSDRIARARAKDRSGLCIARGRLLMHFSRRLVAGLFAPLIMASSAATMPAGRSDPPTVIQIQARTCKQVDSCEEAVQIWCEGYRRADADNDGIPCENICRSKEQVDEIRDKIGC